MPRLIALLLLAACLIGSAVPVLAGETFVDGYHRRDGTYVAPHYRTTPDSSYNNNWSTAPNVNPHTGQQGTREPRLFDGSGNWGGGSGWGTTQPRQRSRW